MKNYRKITPALFIVLFAISVIMLVQNYINENTEFQENVKKARLYADEGILIDADTFYQQAIEIQPDFDISLELANMYVKYKDEDTAINYGEQLIENFPEESEAYSFLLERYVKDEDYEACFQLNDEAQNREIANKTFNKLMKTIEYAYDDGYQSYEDVKVFNHNYCAVLKDGLWGFASAKGGEAVRLIYKNVGIFSNELAPVEDEAGNWYYIDSDGNKRRIVENVKKCTFLGIYNPQATLISDNNKYAYYDDEFNILSDKYEDATDFNGDVAAVCDKGKWYLIDTSFKKSKESYDSILTDEKGLVFRNDRAFGEKDGKYYLINAKGKVVTETAYEKAELFAEADSYAAVCIKGKWGFVDKDGKTVIEPQYEDAHSFSNGLAAVKKDKLWGYIDINNEMVIKNVFLGAKNMSDTGCAFIKDDDEWSIITLYKYNH